MPDLTKDHALMIGSQLSSIMGDAARCLSMVAQAALHDQPGVLDSALLQADMLDDQVTALTVEIRRMRKAMTR
jgi:hypothetical protein